MPTCPLEEADYLNGSGSNSGRRLFKNADPATTGREQSMNPIWRNLENVVLEEGIAADLTAASYAADLAAGFPNFSKALRRAARRFRPTNIQNVTVNANPFLFSLPPDVMVYRLIDAGSPISADSLVHPDPNTNSQNKNRLIYIINDTASIRRVGHSVSGRYARMGPGEGCLFYGNDDGSDTTFWRPISLPLDPAPLVYTTFPAHWFGTSGGALADLDLTFISHGPGRRLMTVNIPTVSFTLSATYTGLFLIPDGGGPFPDQYVPLGGDETTWMENKSPVWTGLVRSGTGFAANTDGFKLGLFSFLNKQLNLVLSSPAGSGVSFTSGDAVIIPAMSLTYIVKH